MPAPMLLRVLLRCGGIASVLLALVACGTGDDGGHGATAAVPIENGVLMIGQREHVPLTGPTGLAVESVNDLVATAARDRLVVLDGETNSLLILSLDGRLLSVTANTGPERAMLSHPIQMAWLDSVTLAVLDKQRPRLARFHLQDNALVPASVLGLDGLMAVSGVCSINGRAFVLGTTRPPDQSKLVHVLAEDGAVSTSFGEPFGGSDEFSRLFYGPGRLLCVPEAQLIVVASHYYPELRAYDERGKLRWVHTIPDYRGVTYRETAPGRMEYIYPDDDVWDYTRSLFQASEDVVALQVTRRRGRLLDSPLAGVRTMLIASSTGREIGIQTDVPLVTAAGAGRLFSIDEAGQLWRLSHSLQGH